MNLQKFSPAARRSYQPEEIEAVGRALSSGRLSVVFGRETMRFEAEFAAFVGHRQAVALSSGTAALEQALQCLGVGYGDEVVVPGYTFAAPALAAMRNLALVRFADIDPLTHNTSLELLQAAVTERTRAVIVPHMFGNPVDVEPIRAWAEARGLFVIEDCCQSAGATLRGARVGRFGHVSCFSFNEIKNMTTGEGGVLATSIDEVAERVRVLRLHGVRNGISVDLGTKCTMTEMEAALGRKQLARLDAMNARRHEAGEALATALGPVPGIFPQHVLTGGHHVYSRFVLRVDGRLAGLDRSALQTALEGHGFALAPVYPVPIYRHDVFVKLGRGDVPKGLLSSYAKIYEHEPALRAYAELRLPGVESFCAEQLGFIVPDVIDDAHVRELADVIAATVQGGSSVGAA